MSESSHSTDGRMRDMKLALRRVRYWCVHRVLEVMAALSRVHQWGHPYGGAPTLRPAPAPDETLGAFEGGKVYAFPHGVVAGEWGGLAISSRNEFFENLTYYFRGASLHPSAVRLVVRSARRLAGTGAYLLTPQAQRNYYHWMADLLPRLWLLEQAGFTSATVDHVFVNATGNKWQHEAVSACGFRPEQIHDCAGTDRFMVDRLLVPDQVQDEARFPKWKADFLRRTFPASAAPPHRLLFCGRRDTTWRRLVNEDELWARLQPLGFAKLEAAGMTVAEQARHFSEARLVLGVHGATLTNMVFCPATAQLIEIQSRELPQTFFTNICATIGVQFHVIAGKPTRRGTDPFDMNRVDIVLSSEQIEAIVAQVEKGLDP